VNEFYGIFVNKLGSVDRVRVKIVNNE